MRIGHLVDAWAGAVGGGGGEVPDYTPPGHSALYATALSAWPM